MFNIIKGPRPTDASKLERWLTPESLDQISVQMKDWHGPPIAVGGVPGNVWAVKGGDFVGHIRDGWEANALDLAWDFGKRLARGFRIATKANQAQFGAGFASLSDLISEATAGKRQELQFSKAGNTGIVGVPSTLWRLGTLPAAGGAATAVPGGRVCNNSITGALGIVNAASGDTLHFVSGNPCATVGPNSLLLYDRLFDCAPNASNATAQAISGTPTRYQNTTVSTAMDYVGGNFGFIEIGATTLAATGHTWTLTYTNQAGTASQTGITTGNAAGTNVDRLDIASGAGQIFATLQAGDTGIKVLTSAINNAVITGSWNIGIGRSIAWLPMPIANMICTTDGINTAFNLVRIFDGACLAFFETPRAATTTTTYTGSLTFCSG